MSSDQRLAKRAAGGDPDAFAAIFRRFQDELYRFCLAILREPQDAQDVVQNTMVKAMRALPGEQREMQLKPWLYRIAHNEAIELRRRGQTVERLDLRSETVVPGTEERVEQGARLKTLLADIADLPERQRATLVMRELNGFDIGEIGAVLDISSGAVRQALYEARRGLGRMESGRAMDCADAMRQVSDVDGRVRRRGVRAHLRACASCRHFQAEMRERKRLLASIPPLPALAVAVGTGAGSGLGAVAGSAGTSALVKAGAGLAALLVVGGAVADHGALLSGSGGAGARTVSHLARPAPAAPVGEAPAPGGGGRGSRTRVSVAPPPERGTVDRARTKATVVRTSSPPSVGREDAVRSSPVLGSTPSAAPAATPVEPPHVAEEVSQVDEPPPRTAGDPRGGETGRPEGVGRPGSPGAESARGPSKQAEPAAHPVHPEHPEHPASPENLVPPEHPVHPEHPAHPEHPVQADGASSSSSEGVEAAPVTEPPPAEEAVTPVEAPAAASANGKAKGHEKQAAPE